MCIETKSNNRKVGIGIWKQKKKKKKRPGKEESSYWCVPLSFPGSGSMDELLL
jgi:hypothetical protein